MTQNKNTVGELAEEYEQLIENRETHNFGDRYISFFDYETNQIVKHSGVKIRYEMQSETHYNKKDGVIKIPLYLHHDVDDIKMKINDLKTNEEIRQKRAEEFRI